MSSPIFVLGIARGGTNLAARVVASVSDSQVVLDALLPAFSLWRDLIEDAQGVRASQRGRPIDDYYFDRGKKALLKHILYVESDRLIGDAEAQRVMLEMASRAALEQQEVRFCGETTSFARLIDSVVVGRERSIRRVFKDVWAIEFLAPLLRVFPGSRGVIVIRDPRDVVASYVRMNPVGLPHLISLLRQWRKAAELCLMSTHDYSPLGGSFVLRYEDLCREPDEWTERLSGYLFGTSPGGADWPVDRVKQWDWAGNSSFGKLPGRPVTSSIGRWTNVLDRETLAVVEMVCGPEMERLGYPRSAAGSVSLPAGLLHTVRSGGRSGYWRSSRRRRELDAVLECLRSAADRSGILASSWRGRFGRLF